MNRYFIGIIGSVLGFLVSQFLVFYTFTTNLAVTKKIEMITLGRELAQEFYKEENTSFKRIRTSIESCDKLYNGFNASGKFDNDSINSYLGFFDDLGFYYHNQAIDIELIDQLFGALIIEAYENNEIRKYIDEIQNRAKQKMAFTNFQSLAQDIEKSPSRHDLTEIARRGCASK